MIKFAADSNLPGGTRTFFNKAQSVGFFFPIDREPFGGSKAKPATREGDLSASGLDRVCHPLFVVP